MNKPILATLFSLALAIPAWGLSSILEIKHSITDDNVVAPESFETQTRLLEENFYLKNYVVPGQDVGTVEKATPALYEERLKRLPTVIEMPYNSIVGNFIEMYLGKRRALVADMVALHSYYGRFFVEELLKEGMPLELQYLPVIESAINPAATSRVGAAGLWQFMPATAKGLGMEVNSLVDERRDTRLSSRNAARYLKQLYEIYGDWSLAIAAYNCGPGNVNKAIRRAGGAENSKMDFWQIYNYLPAETRGYVPAFIAANYVMNYYREHGITPTVIKRHLTTDTVHVNKYVHFNQIASVLNIPVEEIRMLNPQFARDIIPGDYRPYALTLPTQQCLSYLMSEKSILERDADLYARRSYVEPGQDTAPIPEGDGGLANLDRAGDQSLNAETNLELANTVLPETLVKKTHTVGRGENIRDIARAYGVSATDIKRWNHLRRGKVKEGDVLTIEVMERVAPDEVKVVEAPEVAQTTAKELRESVSAETPAKAKAAPARETQAAPAKQQPAPAKKPAAKAATTYKVKKGDNLGRIAAAHGTTVAALQKANGMSPSNTSIQIGQVLKIPPRQAASTKKSTSRKRRRR